MRAEERLNFFTHPLRIFVPNATYQLLTARLMAGADFDTSYVRLGPRGVHSAGIMALAFTVVHTFPDNSTQAQPVHGQRSARPGMQRARLQLRGEFFNALNHTNFNPPGTIFGSSSFGVISSAKSARHIQVGARLAF